MSKYQKGNWDHHLSKKAAFKWANARAKKRKKTYWVITHCANDKYGTFYEIVSEDPTDIRLADILTGDIEVERFDPK